MNNNEAPHRVAQQPVKDAITYRTDDPQAAPDPAIDPHAAAPAAQTGRDEAADESKPARKTAKSKE